MMPCDGLTQTFGYLTKTDFYCFQDSLLQAFLKPFLAALLKSSSRAVRSAFIDSQGHDAGRSAADGVKWKSSELDEPVGEVRHEGLQTVLQIRGNFQ